MPGCPIFSFFPRYRAYNHIDEATWDMRGNHVAQDQRSTHPPFPAPSNGLGASSQMRQTAAVHPAPFVPFGIPTVSPPRRSPNNYATYHTFPRSAVVPKVVTTAPPPQGTFGSVPRIIPVYAPSHPSRHHHSYGHARYRVQTIPAPSRHVHYVDQRYRPRSRQVSAQGSHTPQLVQVYPVPTASRELQSTQGQRRRAHSTGNATRPAVANVTSPRPQQPILANTGHRHQYSRCTGQKKALCIGINYIGQKRELHGCINDIKNVKRFLTRQWGFMDGDIVMLRDDATNPRQMPTRQNMIDAMKWLVKDAQPHDSLFFHYSGHGGQMPDTHGDKTDGFDEVIFPLDYKTAGIIIDDDLHKLMVKPLPRGCRLTAVFDSCHSGTTLDLPFMYHHDGTLKENHIAERSRSLRMSSADVISFAACRDDQTSADTVQGGMAVGAMSYVKAFLTSLTRKPVQSYLELLLSIRDIVQPRFQQKAQLSSGHYIDTNLRFIL